MPGVAKAFLVQKPEPGDLRGDSLGARLRRRRRELGVWQRDAAMTIGVKPWTLLSWERDVRQPMVSMYPAIIRYLGYEPWPQPTTFGEELMAERRRRGLSIRDAAAILGVDEGTFGHWERGDWMPQSRARQAIMFTFLAGDAIFKETRKP